MYFLEIPEDLNTFNLILKNYQTEDKFEKLRGFCQRVLNRYPFHLEALKTLCAFFVAHKDFVALLVLTEKTLHPSWSSTADVQMQLAPFHFKGLVYTRRFSEACRFFDQMQHTGFRFNDLLLNEACDFLNVEENNVSISRPDSTEKNLALLMLRFRIYYHQGPLGWLIKI